VALESHIETLLQDLIAKDVEIERLRQSEAHLHESEAHLREELERVSQIRYHPCNSCFLI